MPASGYVLIWLGVASFVSFVLTMYDKLAAQAGKHRIPEKTLLLTGFFGGAIGEYLTMQLIRHKTKHKKFMISLPLFILLHIIILFLVIYFL